MPDTMGRQLARFSETIKLERIQRSVTAFSETTH
jgi:hypothetical protein